MKPGQVIILPKPDKRYKPGNIVKDKHGQYRGHPDTVTPKFLAVGTERNYPTASSLMPPVIVSKALGRHLGGNI